jgi:hypothetical protein
MIRELRSHVLLHWSRCDDELALKKMEWYRECLRCVGNPLPETDCFITSNTWMACVAEVIWSS